LLYTAEYFDMYHQLRRRAARCIVPILKESVAPGSVIDVGCGSGVWLQVWEELGISDYLGVDGDYVRPESLVIPQDKFLSADLAAPLVLARTFDLVTSFEVAEHLPPSSAETFVDSLTGLGPIVAFSAAIPHQGGEGHLNEQWQDYWMKLFARRGFLAVDLLRPRIWNEPEVADFYLQNTIVYVHESQLCSSKALEDARIRTDESRLAVVHPRVYARLVSDNARLVSESRSIRKLLRNLQSEARARMNKLWLSAKRKLRKLAQGKSTGASQN
jgi:hypothetical protein